MQNAPSLYTPLMQLGRIFAALEESEGELSPELEQELQITQQNLATRAGNILDLMEATTAYEQMADQKEKQAKAAKEQARKFRERLKATLEQAVALYGPIQVDTRKVSLRKSESVAIDDADLIPDELRRDIVVPLQGAPDAAKIKARIKAGHAVPGARVVTNQNLSVR